MEFEQNAQSTATHKLLTSKGDLRHVINYFVKFMWFFNFYKCFIMVFDQPTTNHTHFFSLGTRWPVTLGQGGDQDRGMNFVVFSLTERLNKFHRRGKK